MPGVLEGLSTIAMLLVLALVSEFVFSYFEEYRMQMIGQHVMHDLRQPSFHIYNAWTCSFSIKTQSADS